MEFSLASIYFRMLNLRLCLLVFVVCCGSFCQASKTQPCVFQESEFYSYTEVLNCFHSIYLTDDVKYTTLETLKRALEVYTFYDIAHNSPDPNYPLQVNMQLGLSEIADRPYIYDMDFHEDLRYLFLQLRDAHTQYYLPTCYQNMQIRQAFAPIGIGSSEDTYEIKISPYFPDDLVQWYQFNANINLPDYVNYTITSINGVPALEYFMNYANTSIGISKDSGGRLNFAFTLPEPRDDIPVIMYGYWQQRTRRNPFPQTSSVIYNLKSPSGQSVTLTLPWTFKSLKTYSGVDSWKQDYYYDPSIKSILNVKEKHDVDIVERNFMEIEDFHARKMISLEKQEKLERVYGQLASEMTFELLVNTSHLTFWQLSDNKTLVMYLDTMGPGILSGYYPALIKGFQAAAERGLSRLIIDLSNNGGGNICLGRSLIAFLQKTGWPGEGQNWGPEDIPLSPLAEQLVQAAVKYDVKNTIWSPSFYANQQNQPIANNDTSYLLPGVPHVRGGMIRNYSKLIHINDCGNPGYVLNPAVDFSPEQTIIVTNGFCGSTCAMFACHLGLYDNVKTVVTGGIPGRDAMAYSAFPGGQVLDKEPLFQQLIELRQNVSYVPYDQIDPNDVVPRNIPTTADFRFCVREIYPLAQPNFTYGTKPMEFSFEDATHHLYNNEVTAVYPQYVWYEVLNYF